MKDSYIGQAWLVLLLSLAFGGLLAGVQATLGPKIAKNKRNETYDQIPALVTLREWQEPHDLVVIAVADAAKTEEVDANGKIAYKAFSAGGKHVGWVIKGAGQGFADRIELLIGLDTTGSKILGMYVLDQKETPALGDRIREAMFRDQFQGKLTAEPLEVADAVTSASAKEVIAVTGATVSSESVCEIVNKAVAEFRLWLETQDASQPGQAQPDHAHVEEE